MVLISFKFGHSLHFDLVSHKGPMPLTEAKLKTMLYKCQKGTQTENGYRA